MYELQMVVIQKNEKEMTFYTVLAHALNSCNILEICDFRFLMSLKMGYKK